MTALFLLFAAWHFAWTLWLCCCAVSHGRKMRDIGFRSGVLHGHAATRWPGDPQWREARELLDELEAESLLKALENARERVAE